ncbi:mRNA-decapping enzyme 1A isoform X1 [Phyllopteryx taeniolatus]|uniref:mRNA-decapping enzyme 1A isoform X1 n=2 Tax=Phyllopteryx taeniolatus TaxID=161469 RepID=UPI002AD40AA1|nr:mRNA-decapping enzyme 1A isoform X1 [Phyllopteryx taeniolatus]
MDTANAGQMMSLAALQRQDPYIRTLLDVTGQVALYNFNSMANEWEKTEIEGTLFVYTRSASPHHGFTIMNRLSAENLVEPINKDLEFQLQDPFLLYRNGNMGIYSIWFYDKRDCQRISQLMVKIVKVEAEHAKRQSPEKAEPRRPNGLSEARPRDILELLSKAKEEYQKAQSRDADVSTEPNAMGTLNHVRSSQPPDKKTHTMVKQITVEELFGSSIPKDPSLPAMPTQNPATASGEPSLTYPQNQTYPHPVHPSPLHPPHLAAQDAGSEPVHQGHGLLQKPYALHPSPVFQSVGPETEPRSLCPVSPLMVPPAASQTQTFPAGPAVHAAPSRAYMEQELLGSLKPSVQSLNVEIHKPILAPNFLPSTLVPPHNFQECMRKPVLQLTQEMDVLSKAPNLIKPTSAVPMSPGLALSGSDSSVLLSPSAFQQSLNKTGSAVVPPPPAKLLSTTAGSLEPQQPSCNKARLQKTLIHLIKNDPAFLGAIHDAYLQSLSKDFSSLKL